MSYILDALRRADAERERGSVPSIHTQQQFASSLGGEDDTEGPSRRLRWVVAGLAAALVAAVAWILLRAVPEPPVAAAPRPIGGLPPTATSLPNAPGTAGTTVTATPAGANPPAATGPAATPGTSVALAPPAAPHAGTVAPAAPAAAASPRPAARTAASSPAAGDDSARGSRRPARHSPSGANEGTTASPSGAARPAAPPPVARTGPDTPPPGPAMRPATEKMSADKATPEKAPEKTPDRAATDAERIYAQRELPEDVRRALPPITVNGSTWSNDAANRMLMIGGQLYHEGDAIAPGVVLQRIKQRSAILAFRGYRYEMTF